MVYLAIAVVFGPSIALITILDVLYWTNFRNMRERLGKWTRRGLKFVLSTGSNFWVLYALGNAQNWGVDPEGLEAIKASFAYFQGQIPVIAALPSEVFLFIALFFVVYLVVI